MPGYESMRMPGQPVFAGDSNVLYLGELCQAIGNTKEIHISRFIFINFIIYKNVLFRHIFVPREFLTQNLERHLNSSLMKHLRSADDVAEYPRRPSEMLSFLNSKLHALQNLDAFCTFLKFCFLTFLS